MLNACDAPLRFAPLFRRYLWGGRRLATLLNKSLGEGDDYAESWEVVDHGRDQSVVLAGSLAGQTLHALVGQYAASLFGAELNNMGRPRQRFPLLLKFLDCNQTLSVQVHPDDERAARLDPPDLGKTEAWVVVAAATGSRIYAGLRDGVNREQLAEALAEGACAEYLHEFTVQVGDCVFIPAGTVHALGAGLVIAEIQQASDATFRLFDWNRLDKQGLPRPLHVAESLDAIDFQHGPVSPQVPQSTREVNCELLVNCDKFVLRRHTIEAPQVLGGSDGFHVLAVLDGAIDLENDPLGVPLARGETALLPAAAGKVAVRPHGRTVVLDISEPVKTG